MTPPIGARVRAVRLDRGLSLRKLAEAVGVSPSLISQIENGKSQPSVQTLYAIVHHLNLTVDELMDDAATPQAPLKPTSGAAAVGARVAHDAVVRGPAEHRKIEMENGVTWEQLAGWGHGDVDAFLVTYAPGGASSVEGRLMRHHGTEYAYIIEGTLTLQLEFDRHELPAGASLHFDSIRPHMYLNDTDQVVRGVWFVVGRRNQNTPAAPRETTELVPTAPTSFTDVIRVIDGLR